MKRAAVALLGALLVTGCTSTPPPPEPVIAMEAVVSQIESDGEDFDLRVKAASACLEIVSHPLTGRSDRLEFAKQALQHAERAIQLDDEKVHGHYYRAVAIGQILDSEILPDLGRISDLEASGLRAKEIDPSYSCAGPLRLLGMLYWKAPAWPIGPEDAGEPDVIEELFVKALELQPTCSQNYVAFAEFLEDEGREEEALERARSAQALLDKGQPHLRPHEIKDLQRRTGALLAELSPSSQ